VRDRAGRSRRSARQNQQRFPNRRDEEDAHPGNGGERAAREDLAKARQPKGSPTHKESEHAYIVRGPHNTSLQHNAAPRTKSAGQRAAEQFARAGRHDH